MEKQILANEISIRINWNEVMQSLLNNLNKNIEKYKKYMFLNIDKIKVLYFECIEYFNSHKSYFEIFGIDWSNFIDNEKFNEFLNEIKFEKNAQSIYPRNSVYNKTENTWDCRTTETCIESVFRVSADKYFKNKNPSFNEIAELCFGIFFNIKNIFENDQDNPFFKDGGLNYSIICIKDIISEWSYENKLILFVENESGIFSNLSVKSLFERIEKLENDLQELKNDKCQQEINELKQEFLSFSKQLKDEIRNNKLQSGSPKQFKSFLKRLSEIGIVIFTSTISGYLVNKIVS